jgi:predicted ATPase
MQQTFGKLKQLTVKGFKSIREIDALELTDINIVIGQNGAGKSNFISLFRFLPKAVSSEFSNYIIKQGGIGKILFFGPKETSALELSLRSGLYQFGTALEPTAEGGLSCAYMKLESNDQVMPLQTIDPLEYHHEQKRKFNNFILKQIEKRFEKWRVYHFHDTSENSPLRSSAPLTEPERLATDGGNLAAFLYFLQERHPGTFEAILNTVRQIAPFLGTLVLRPEALNPNLIRLRWRHVGHDELFDVSDLSDGTLRFLALTALLLQPDPPSTIVLDEPELGLHPAAIAQLAALIHQVAPQVQIIAATQSPTFANHFGWQDFIIADRYEDASRFRRLKEEEVSAWMDEYAMGEIWEKNLIGGRP